MQRRLWLLVVLLMVIFSACGYRFTGGGELPFGIKKIFVPMFQNRSSETGIENIITNDFIYEFTRSDKVEVVEKGAAEAVFSGVITAVSTETISRTGLQSPVERRVTVYLNLRLTDVRGNDLWTVRSISDDETYEVLTEKLLTERRKIGAIKILSRRMAEMTYNLITDIE